MGKTYPGQVDLSTWEQGYYTAVDDNTGKRVKVHVRKGEPRPKIYNNMHLPMYSDGKGNFYSYVPEGMVSLDRPWSVVEVTRAKQKELEEQLKKERAQDQVNKQASIQSVIDYYNDLRKRAETDEQFRQFYGDITDEKIANSVNSISQEMDEITQKSEEDRQRRIEELDSTLQANAVPLQEAVVIAKANHPEIIEMQEARQALADRYLKDLTTEQNVRAALKRDRGDIQVKKQNEFDLSKYILRATSLGRYSNLQDYDIRENPEFEKVWNFYQNDVTPRMTRAWNSEHLLTPARYNVIASNPLTRYKFYTMNSDMIGGFVPGFNYSVIALSNPSGSTIAHETDHAQRGELGSSSLGAFSYTPKERQLLSEAYDYPFWESFAGGNPYEMQAAALGNTEKSSMNRQIRYNIYDNTGLTGSALDDYIDNMSDKELFDYYNTDYVQMGLSPKSMFWYEKTLPKIKEALRKKYPNMSDEEISNAVEEAATTFEEKFNKNSKEKQLLSDPQKLHELMQKLRAALKYVADNDTYQSPFNFQYMT